MRDLSRDVLRPRLGDSAGVLADVIRPTNWSMAICSRNSNGVVGTELARFVGVHDPRLRRLHLGVPISDPPLPTLTDRDRVRPARSAVWSVGPFGIVKSPVQGATPREVEPSLQIGLSSRRCDSHAEVREFAEELLERDCSLTCRGRPLRDSCSCLVGMPAALGSTGTASTGSEAATLSAVLGAGPGLDATHADNEGASTAFFCSGSGEGNTAVEATFFCGVDPG
jgi:hypothetical protein